MCGSHFHTAVRCQPVARVDQVGEGVRVAAAGGQFGEPLGRQDSQPIGGFLVAILCEAAHLPTRSRRPLTLRLGVPMTSPCT